MLPRRTISPRPRAATTSALALTFVGAPALAQQFSPSSQPAHDGFHWLSVINKASAVMVVERGIVPRPLGAKIADAIAKSIEAAQKPGAQRSGDYLVVEKALIAAGGPDVTRLHSGRSRQDISATVQRLGAREDLLYAFTRLADAREAALTLGARHPDAIMPAYTWGVQAQPVSFGHYMLAYATALSRLSERMREAYARLNMSPMGSAALGTSSFPVDRPRLAALLGFDGVMENSLDAGQIAPIDSGSEIASLAEAGALTVGAFIADVTSQYAQSKPWLLLADGPQTGGSSIMPQKRNPFGLVFLRGRASVLIGRAHSFTLSAHNVASGMGDYKPIDPKQGDLPNSILRDAGDLFGDFQRLVSSLVFDEKRALDEVEGDYSMTTELADMLQRLADVPFRVGHHFASELVKFGRAGNLRPAQIAYADAQRIYAEAAKGLGVDGKLPLTEEQFKLSLSPANMVRSSQGLGGPQPAEVARMMAAERARLAQDRQWAQATRARWQDADRALEAAFAALSKP